MFINKNSANKKSTNLTSVFVLDAEKSFVDKQTIFIFYGISMIIRPIEITEQKSIYLLIVLLFSLTISIVFVVKKYKNYEFNNSSFLDVLLYFIFIIFVVFFTTKGFFDHGRNIFAILFSYFILFHYIFSVIAFFWQNFEKR